MENLQEEEVQGGWNEGEQIASDSTSQVAFQKSWEYLVWVVVCCPLQHPRSSRSSGSSAAGTEVTGIVEWVDHYLGLVGILLGG